MRSNVEVRCDYFKLLCFSYVSSTQIPLSFLPIHIRTFITSEFVTSFRVFFFFFLREMDRYICGFPSSNSSCFAPRKLTNIFESTQHKRHRVMFQAAFYILQKNPTQGHINKWIGKFRTLSWLHWVPYS